ncbi:hypothetical protein JHK85_024022 [Glycine max]|nr:hypothetical protein JHK85_024022 [Glycine max]
MLEENVNIMLPSLAGLTTSKPLLGIFYSCRLEQPQHWMNIGKHIEKDPALERRFQPDETIQILKGLRGRYEIHHKLRYTDVQRSHLNPDLLSIIGLILLDLHASSYLKKQFQAIVATSYPCPPCHCDCSLQPLLTLPKEVSTPVPKFTRELSTQSSDFNILSS